MREIDGSAPDAHGAVPFRDLRLRRRAQTKAPARRKLTGMPALPKRYCTAPGSRCPEYAVKNGRCLGHQRKDRDTRSTAAQDWHRLYGSRWQRYRLVFLMEHPLCADPFGVHELGPEPGVVVDHRTPHRGDVVLFWDGDNHQPLCSSCHGRKTAEEDGGFGNAGRTQDQDPG